MWQTGKNPEKSFSSPVCPIVSGFTGKNLFTKCLLFLTSLLGIYFPCGASEPCFPLLSPEKHTGFICQLAFGSHILWEPLCVRMQYFFCPINLSHVNLVIRPTGRTRKDRRKLFFLPYNILPVMCLGRKKVKKQSFCSSCYCLS